MRRHMFVRHGGKDFVTHAGGKYGGYFAEIWQLVGLRCQFRDEAIRGIDHVTKRPTGSTVRRREKAEDRRRVFIQRKHAEGLIAAAVGQVEVLPGPPVQPAIEVVLESAVGGAEAVSTGTPLSPPVKVRKVEPVVVLKPLPEQQPRVSSQSAGGHFRIPKLSAAEQESKGKRGRREACAQESTGVRVAEAAEVRSTTSSRPSSSDTGSRSAYSSSSPSAYPGIWISGREVTSAAVVAAPSTVSSTALVISGVSYAQAVTFGARDVRIYPSKELKEKLERQRHAVAGKSQVRHVSSATSSRAPVCAVQVVQRPSGIPQRLGVSEKRQGGVQQIRQLTGGRIEIGGVDRKVSYVPLREQEKIERAVSRSQTKVTFARSTPTSVTSSIPAPIFSTVPLQPIPKPIRKPPRKCCPTPYRVHDCKAVGYDPVEALKTPEAMRKAAALIEPGWTQSSVEMVSQPGGSVVIAETCDTSFPPGLKSVRQNLSSGVKTALEHLQTGFVPGNRTYSEEVRMPMPLMMAEYCQPHIAWKVLDILERPASLPGDRSQWIEYITEEIVGEAMSGSYAITRISVGAAIAMWEWMTVAREERLKNRDGYVIMQMAQMLSGTADGDVVMPTVMSYGRMLNRASQSLQIDHRAKEKQTAIQSGTTSSVAVTFSPSLPAEVLRETVEMDTSQQRNLEGSVLVIDSAGTSSAVGQEEVTTSVIPDTPETRSAETSFELVEDSDGGLNIEVHSPRMRKSDPVLAGASVVCSSSSSGSIGHLLSLSEPPRMSSSPLIIPEAVDSSFDILESEMLGLEGEELEHPLPSNDG